MAFCLNYCLYISVAGTILLFFLAICCFVNMEILELPHGKKNQRGVAVLVASIVLINYPKKFLDLWGLCCIVFI